MPFVKCIDLATVLRTGTQSCDCIEALYFIFPTKRENAIDSRIISLVDTSFHFTVLWHQKKNWESFLLERIPMKRLQDSEHQCAA